jgi:hypothetical protein
VIDRLASVWCAVALLSACSGGDGPLPVADAGLAAPVPAAQVAVGQAAGRLSELEGTVTLEHHGASAPVTQAIDFVVHDAIETGDDGRATLTFANGRVVELGPEGRFEVSEDNGGVVLSVARGLVLTRVPAKAVDAGDGTTVSLTISTPFGLTRVGASTSVRVQVDGERAELEVKIGELELVSKQGERKTLAAGEHSVLGAPRELPAISLSVVLSTGRVELKANGAKSFVPVNPKKLPTLAEGDDLKVLDGKLTLAPGDSSTRFTLLRGSEAIVGAAAKSDDAEASALELKQGELQVQAARGQKRVAIGNGVMLQSDLGAQYSVRRGASGLEVTSLIGDLKIVRVGQPDVPVVSGGSAVVGAAVKVVEPVREAVVLPTHPGLRVAHTGLPRASLSWDAGEGVTVWRVVVSTDAAFSTTVLDGLVHQPFVNVAVPARGALYWRVYESQAADAEPTSHGNAAFTPDVNPDDLSRVKNVVPDGPETTTIYFQDKPPTVTFTWKKREGAVKYAVKVYRDGELGKAVAERAVSEAQVALPESTLAEGNYRWSVTPLDAKGAELEGGRLNKLTMVYDNAVAQLVLKSPKNGDPVVAGQVKAVGIAPVGSKVFVNGKAAVLDGQARFEATVAPLAQGRVVVRSVGAGSETFTVRTVRK